MATIHPTALIDRGAEIDGSASIGPYCVVGPGVVLEADCVLHSHVVIEGPARIGRANHFHPFSRIGGAPQDKKYGGEPTGLEIGDRNTFRESVTVNRGTLQDKGTTRIGSDNWVMAYVHIAHDCVVGDQVIFANSTNLAGHVEIGDWVILGGYTGVHQFCKVGAHAMTGVGTVLLHDLPPYVMAAGNTAQAHGLNTEGLRRRGFSAASIAALRGAYKTLYKSGLTLEQAKTELGLMARQGGEGAEAIAPLAEFLTRVSRGIVR